MRFDGKAEEAANFYTAIFSRIRRSFRTVLGEMLQDRDATKSRGVMEAMLKMDKLDISRLQQAYAQS